MSKSIDQFIERVNRLEQRFKRDRYADQWLMPRDLLLEVRDELVSPMLPEPEIVEEKVS